MDLDDYQEQALRTNVAAGEDERELVVPLLGLASEVGDLFTEYKKWLRDGEAHEYFRQNVADELGDSLWYLANIASKLNFPLSEIANRNLRKVVDRWGNSGQPAATPLLDESDPPDERLPRQFEVEFQSHEARGVVHLFLVEGGQLGDRLSDRSWVADGYRFHDVFHLSHAAVLSWSPVMRGFLRCRRVSQPDKNEIEDGGRAKVIDEAVAALVYDYARKQRYLEGITTLDFRLLSAIKSLTFQLEVRDKTAWEWEQAIFQGYDVWRALRDNNGGRIAVDLEERTITYAQATS
jgi:NTP pyrophosphatase (non-canonical NTP hydrolase)